METRRRGGGEERTQRDEGIKERRMEEEGREYKEDKEGDEEDRDERKENKEVGKGGWKRRGEDKIGREGKEGKEEGEEEGCRQEEINREIRRYITRKAWEIGRGGKGGKEKGEEEGRGDKDRRTKREGRQRWRYELERMETRKERRRTAMNTYRRLN